MYKLDLALNNLQKETCYITQPTNLKFESSLATAVQRLFPWQFEAE